MNADLILEMTLVDFASFWAAASKAVLGSSSFFRGPGASFRAAGKPNRSASSWTRRKAAVASAVLPVLAVPAASSALSASRKTLKGIERSVTAVV